MVALPVTPCASMPVRVSCALRLGVGFGAGSGAGEGQARDMAGTGGEIAGADIDFRSVRGAGEFGRDAAGDILAGERGGVGDLLERDLRRADRDGLAFGEIEIGARGEGFPVGAVQLHVQRAIGIRVESRLQRGGGAGEAEIALHGAVRGGGKIFPRAA